MRESSEPALLSLSEDTAAASWISQRATSSSGTVGSLLPNDFDAYARVFHPAILQRRDPPELVRWSEVAQIMGRVVHPVMEWEALVGTWDYEVELPTFDTPLTTPSQGALLPDLRDSLAHTLTPFTGTPEACWFAVWEGHGDIWPLDLKAPLVQTPYRQMFLFTGPLAAASTSLTGKGGVFDRSPNLWWPEDHSWCVATEIDLKTTYVGGSAECIAAVIANSTLEASPATADQTFTWTSDSLNPQPPKPY